MNYVKDCLILESKGMKRYGLHPIKIFGDELHEM